MAFVRIVTREGLPQAKDLLENPIHAQPRTVHQSQSLKHVRQQGIAPGRRVPKDVVRCDTAYKTAGVCDFQAVLVQMDVDGLTEEIVPMDQRVQNSFARGEPGHVGQGQFTKTLGGQGHDFKIGFDQPLERLKKGKQGAFQVVANVVSCGCFVAEENDLVLGGPTGQGPRLAQKENGGQGNFIPPGEAQVFKKFLVRKLVESLVLGSFRIDRAAEPPEFLVIEIRKGHAGKALGCEIPLAAGHQNAGQIGPCEGFRLLPHANFGDAFRGCVGWDPLGDENQEQSAFGFDDFFHIHQDVGFCPVINLFLNVAGIEVTDALNGFPSSQFSIGHAQDIEA